jgi:hypothetical protein
VLENAVGEVVGAAVALDATVGVVVVGEDVGETV